MARPLRIELPDGVYHVTSRGLERRRIVTDDGDRRHWVGLLDAVATRRQWRMYSWVLLDNHFHLFLRTPHADLSAGMHDLNSGYATWFNRRHRRCGPLFQGRFKGILVESDCHYWELTRYVHLNPVRAGLVKDPARYEWGSCGFYFDASTAPPWLAWEEVLREHGGKLRAARRAYRRYLLEGVSSPPDSPLGGAVASTVLGSSSFVDRIREWVRGRLPDREVPSERPLREVVSVSQVKKVVAAALSVSESSLCEARRWGNAGRSVAVYLCRRLTGVRIGELGEEFGGVSGQAISKTALQVARQMSSDRGLRRLVSDCESVLSKK